MASLTGATEGTPLELVICIMLFQVAASMWAGHANSRQMSLTVQTAMLCIDS